MKAPTLNLGVSIRIKLPLWDALKLRLAGREVREAMLRALTTPEVEVTKGDPSARFAAIARAGTLAANEAYRENEAAPELTRRQLAHVAERKVLLDALQSLLFEKPSDLARANLVKSIRASG